jgi:hypothetical protein
MKKKEKREKKIICLKRNEHCSVQQHEELKEINIHLVRSDRGPTNFSLCHCSRKFYRRGTSLALCFLTDTSGEAIFDPRTKPANSASPAKQDWVVHADWLLG